MTARNKIIFWLAAFAAFIAFIVIFKPVLLPFVLGLIVAYLLNPLVRKFKAIKISRGTASLIILLGFLLFLTLLLAISAPLLYRQLLQLADDLPGYIDSLWNTVQPVSSQILNRLGINTNTDVQSLLQGNTDTAVDVAKKLAGGLASGGQAIFNVFFVLTVMPIVAYFVMREWETITNFVEDLLPRDQKQTIMDLLKQIDGKISGFIRGQISVAFILGVAYAIALTIAGLKYGFLIGLTAGFISIIPMVGSTLGLVVSITVAWFQTGELGYVAIIGAIFLVGQLIEGNILSPKIVGDSVGMHPLWVFFALLAGGALFGLLGMLIAVPVAAAAGVLIAFGIKQYKSSSLYKGKAQKKPPPKK